MIASTFDRLRQSSLARNAGWMFAGQGLSVVTQGIYFIVLARLLGVAEYGLIVGVSALTGIAAQYSALGSGFVFLRHVGPTRSLFARYWGNILVVVAIAGSAAVAIVATVGSVTFPGAGIVLVLLVAVGDCIFNQLTFCCAQVFQTFEQMRLTATLTLLSNFLRMVAALLWLLTLGQATAVQWAGTSLLISAVLAVTAVGIVTRRFGRPSFDVRSALSRAGEGFVFSLSGSSTVVYNDLDKAMLGHYGMNAANGAYTLAYRVLDIAFLPVRSIHSAAIAKFFRLGSDSLGSAERFAIHLLRRTAVLGGGAAVGMLVFAPVIPILVGHSFDEAVSAIRWLCLIPLLRCFHIGAGDALTGAGLQRVRLLLQTGAASLNLGLNLWLIPQYSWRGAAFASVVTDGVLAAITWTALLMLRRREGFRLRHTTEIETTTR